jgi:hypothetical protein
MYGVWRQKWPQDWTPRWPGDYPRDGLLHLYALRDEAYNVANREASIAGAKRLREAMDVLHAPTTTTYRRAS